MTQEPKGPTLPPLPIPPNAKTAALELILQMRLSGPAVERPLLAPGALWPRHLAPALARAGHAPADFASIVVRVVATYPGPAGKGAQPDLSLSDYAPEFVAYLGTAFVDTPWQPLFGGADVREEWRPDADTRLDIAVYGRRA